jgi:hypothetical protein
LPYFLTVVSFVLFDDFDFGDAVGLPTPFFCDEWVVSAFCGSGSGSGSGSNQGSLALYFPE